MPLAKAAMPENCQLSNTHLTGAAFQSLLALGMSHTQLATTVWVRSLEDGP